ncbi:Protein of unknown function [Sporobacter termitidis DSM 10068]|uniref:DUF2500 domain-containing protein n=1 Tax=Sporobacter termitidis DSM 10068 TaxID=1123282 RepID=A0A1M5Z721_9FIRM|nr:DUF2500 domain-containing protein [Sporobacter termitidis]SHI19991.1 Protein of unknown function [Sporobacter termitidis DSM 10068]
MGFLPFSGFGLFSIIPTLVVLIFVVVLVMLIVRAVQGAAQWKRNNDSPVLTVDAAVITKRADVQHYQNTGTDNMTTFSSSTTYYATFEVPSGGRMELRVRDSEYGMLAEGDRGKLTFQGTRYLGFDRERS